MSNCIIPRTKVSVFGWLGVGFTCLGWTIAFYLGGVPAMTFLLKFYGVHSNVFPKIRTVDPSASPHRGQLCFIWNSQHMGRVVLPLQLLVSNDNVVNVIPYFPACPKFSDKRHSKLYKTWAERLVNVSHRWDSTLDRILRSSLGMRTLPPWPFHPAIWKHTFVRGLMQSDIAFDQLWLWR